MSDSDPMDCSPRGFSVHGDSPGKNIKNGLPCPPPGDLPNLGITPTSPALQESVHSLPKMWILYQLSHLGSPRTLMWVAYPLPRGSSQPRNRTGVSSVARRFFTNWAMREAHIKFQFSSVAQSSQTLCDPMNYSTPGLPVHHQLPEFTETHVHRVSDAIQPSHPMSSPSPPAPNPSQHQSLFQWVNSSHEVAKVLEFQL